MTPKYSKHESALVGAAGEELVAAQLLRRHIDVAYPAVDGGIDLLAYKANSFRRAIPVQVKAASGTRFLFLKSWFRIKNLALVHVWRITDTPEFYVFGSLKDVEAVLGPQHCNTASWKERGRWSNTKPTGEQIARMQHHRDRWDRITNRL